MMLNDPLADVLEVLRVRGAVMAHVRAHAPWGLELPRAEGATFHAVTGGACWVRVPGYAPRELHTGDVVLLPTGASHVVAAERAGPTRKWDRVAKSRARTAAGEIVIEGRGASTHLICAAYGYDRDVAHPLLSLLPPVLFVSGQAMAAEGAIPTTLRLLRHELTARSPGWGATINRLTDVLFVQVLRAWLAQHDGDERSWLLALRDPAIAQALTALHADPAARWTIDGLARRLNLSRSTLTRRFAALVGEPPLAYLTRWRMDLAARELRDGNDAVGSIGRRVGYTSEFAFSRAFTRHRGQPPSRYRADARQRRDAS